MDIKILIIVSIFVAIALAFDAFSVAVSAGAYFRKTTWRQRFRLSFHFGLFQFIMPIIGWFLGEKTSKLLQNYDHWVAFIILSALGIKMILESTKSKEIKEDITRGWKLIALSISTSLDALAIGFGLALLDGQILLMALIIGIVAGAGTYLGIFIGETLAGHFQRNAQILAGIVLILIGTQILLNHLGVM
jgi:putative Mn2+ efflux pump MntP